MRIYFLLVKNLSRFFRRLPESRGWSRV